MRARSASKGTVKSLACAAGLELADPPRAESRVPRLIVIKGTDEGKQFELTGDVLEVGRETGNHIRLHDTEGSRRHAEFRRVEVGYHLLDKGSANGTFVNNH